MDMEKMIVVEKSTKWWLTVATGGALAVGLMGGYGLATAIHGTNNQQSAIQQTATMPGAPEQGQNAGNGMDHSAYTTIAKLCDEKGVKLVLDTTKDLLTKCLPYHPFIIKPNHHELGEIFGVTIETEEQIVNYAKQLQQMGARNVLISRGGDGAMLITETGEVYTSNVPKGTLVNSVGAGDSMLSGFMAKFIETGDYAASLKQGAATGSATAFSVGIAEKAFIEELLPQVVVTKQ